MSFPIRITDQLTPHLRALRKARGLTQAQLGELLGLKQARVAEIESKPGSVSLDQLARVLAALGAALHLHAAESGSGARAAKSGAAADKPSKAKSGAAGAASAARSRNTRVALSRRLIAPGSAPGTGPRTPVSHAAASRPPVARKPGAGSGVVIQPKKGSW